MTAQGLPRYYRRIIEDYYREAKYELVHYKVSTPGSTYFVTSVPVDPDSVKGGQEILTPFVNIFPCSIRRAENQGLLHGKIVLTHYSAA
jgi:hypothetical protein